MSRMIVREINKKKVLQGDKEERNIVQTIKRRVDNWIGHILRWNTLLKERYREGWSDGKTRKKA